MSSEKNEEMWRRNLSPLAYKVTREHATEPAFSYSETHTSNGQYTCVCCGSLLFENADKFESGSGWPSFTKPASGAEIGETTDRSYNMTRTEVHCSNCEIIVVSWDAKTLFNCRKRINALWRLSLVARFVSSLNKK